MSLVVPEPGDTAGIEASLKKQLFPSSGTLISSNRFFVLWVVSCAEQEFGKSLCPALECLCFRCNLAMVQPNPGLHAQCGPVFGLSASEFGRDHFSSNSPRSHSDSFVEPRANTESVQAQAVLKDFPASRCSGEFDFTTVASVNRPSVTLSLCGLSCRIFLSSCKNS